MQKIIQRFGALAIGLAFAIIGGIMYFQNNHLTQVCTAETEATVVNMKQEFTGDTDGTGYMYYPVIEYIANDQTVQVTMPDGSSTPTYSINEKLNILYNPNKTDEFILKDNTFGAIFPLAFAGLGVIVTIVGIIIAIKGNA